MTSTGWHLTPSVAERYWVRDVDSATAASIDAHLVGCDQCQALMNTVSDAAMIDIAWSAIVDALDRPALGITERVLVRAGATEATARIVAATPRARWSYLFVVAASVTLALLSASSAPRSDAWFVAFLLLAPLGPLAATAGAFGRLVDPIYAVLRTLPTSSLRIVLIRTVAGVVPSIVLTALVTPLLLDRGWLAVAWLLPSLAITLLVLALATWFDIELVAAAVAAIWIGVPVTLRMPLAELIQAFSGPLQLTSILVGAIAAGVGVARGSSYDWGGR